MKVLAARSAAVSRVGWTSVAAIDPVAMKRDAALKLGATDVIDPSATDPIEGVRALSGGRGADSVLKASSPPGLRASRAAAQTGVRSPK